MLITFKDFSVEPVVLGSFRLDGGAMFGSVPKNLWNRAIPADDENCIPLATRSLLVRSASRTILVDVGMGEKWTDKQRQIFSIQNRPTAALPFTASEITDVILTHLHFDHAGGISYYDADKLTCTYPNATIHVQAANLKNALAPNQREAASYLIENAAVVRDGRVNLLLGNTSLFEGIAVEVANGHTAGLQWLRLFDDTKTAVFPSDLMPTAHHVPLPYLMGYDMCAQTALSEKQAFLERAVAEKWLVVFQHDRDTACSYIERDEKGRYKAAQLQAG